MKQPQQAQSIKNARRFATPFSTFFGFPEPYTHFAVTDVRIFRPSVPRVRALRERPVVCSLRVYIVAKAICDLICKIKYSHVLLRAILV